MGKKTENYIMQYKIYTEIKVNVYMLFMAKI